MQRLSAFGACFVMGILCFCLSAIYIPVLILKARKFALLYSLGSLFFLMRYILQSFKCLYSSNILIECKSNFGLLYSFSFSFLWGPMNYLKSLFTVERRCFSITYIVTLTGTLYFALHLQSTSLTVLCAVLQLIAMLTFLISHIPGGTTGLMFFTRMFKSSVSSTLPI